MINKSLSIIIRLFPIIIIALTATDNLFTILRTDEKFLN